jgi:hypothetical protein
MDRTEEDRFSRLIKERAHALEEISGTEGFRVLVQTLRDLEVGTMREAFESRNTVQERWDYYAGQRDAIIAILTAISAIRQEGVALAEQDDEREEEITAEELGIQFGSGSLS